MHKHWLGFEYCKPSEAGLASEAVAVEKRLSRLLTSMAVEVSDLTVAYGELTETLRNTRLDIHQKLQLDGWIIRGREDGGYSVYHPATIEDRNILAAAAAESRATSEGLDRYHALVKKALARRRIYNRNPDSFHLTDTLGS